MTLLAGLWAVVFVSYVVVLVMRTHYGHMEDDHLHAFDGEPAVARQAAIAHKLDVLDRWKAILLTIVVVYGLALAIYHLYTVWVYGSAIHVE